MHRRRPIRSAILSAFGALACAGALLAQASAQTLLRDAEIEEWLEEYTEPLVEAAGLAPGSVDIYILGDSSLNAFVAGGSNMFVHTGLITTADTPNQIEGVLAHETGHIAGAHLARGAEAMAQAGRPAMLSLVLGAALIAAGAPPEAGMAAVGLGQTVGVSNYLAYSRGQESAADQAGLSYLDRVGHSGEGLIETFDKLGNRQLLSSRAIDPYMQTHPLSRDRVARLRDRASQMAHWEVRDTPEEIERLQMIQGKINGFMDAPYTTLRRYPLSDQSAPARYARAVAYYRMSDLDKASTEIDRLIEEQPENPYFAELKGQMLFEHGKIADSIAPHRRSTELAPDEPLLKINLARALVAMDDQKDVEEAVGILGVALQMESDNSFAWTELARAQARLGREALASLAQAEAFFSAGDLPSAHRFASRASDKLEAGTPEHQQALDIMNASEDAARKARRSRGRG
ncbi:M48 family metalloprotease [Parvularcula dongshanensis]|uniref:Putative Zn-dependent protease n=1 Tax=Parvularcula dongshanensis TaxID=1173995 RepID=A0A840I6H5_9PROT|nr:M48 family metalloprotease [Parvularcula dongshanensis]MBB4659853.1 putative Zn-dependent protease [Parvularcula dongshanensis]